MHQPEYEPTRERQQGWQGTLVTIVVTAVLLGLYTLPVWAVLGAVAHTTRIPAVSWPGILTGHVVIGGVITWQYVAGKRRALTAVTATELRAAEYKHLRKAACVWSDELGIDTPQLSVGTFGSVNAFAVGRKNAGEIVFSKALLRELSPSQQRVALAHELSHLRSHDTTLMMLGSGLETHVETLKRELMHAMDDNIGALIVFKPVLIMVVVARALVMIPLRFLSRHREYQADADAASLCGPGMTATTLTHVHEANKQILNTPGPGDAVETLCIDAVSRSRLARVFATHPPLVKRVTTIQADYQT